MNKVDICIIGAGVAGLAIAEKLSGHGKNITLLEKNESFGQEISSRNSEVIHSGIYYVPGSLKAKLSVLGNQLLYAYLKENNILHSMAGKLIVAANQTEIKILEKLICKGIDNGVQGIELLEKEKIKVMEPEIRAEAAVFVPSAGIFDTHAYMKSLFYRAKAKGCIAAFNCQVTGIKKNPKGFIISCGKDNYEFFSSVIINCAGLGSSLIARLAGIDIDKAAYRLHYCKGDYFRTTQKINIRRLVYPSPEPAGYGLGIHCTPDLAGKIRFGPDTEYVPTLQYSVDERKKTSFSSAIRKFLPSLDPASLYPDTSGIRPKLQGPKEGFRDFVISHESAKGLPGLINLIGIESPGLTSSLAIAEHVEKIVNEIL